MQARIKRRRLNSKFPQTYPNAAAHFSSENCGACLLPIVDPAEREILFQDHDLLIVVKPDVCEHLFHSNCIQTWATRDTSCPLCRLRFSLLGLYRADGALTETKKYDQVFLSDVLDAEEEELTDDESEEVRPEQDLEPPLQEPEPPLQELEPPRRAGKKAVHKVPVNVEQRLSREVAKMREQLVYERQRELREQERLLEKVDSQTIKISILKNIKRLPYQFTAGGSRPKALVVPKIRVKPSEVISSSNRFKHLITSPPKYDDDFLGSGSAGGSR